MFIRGYRIRGSKILSRLFGLEVVVSSPWSGSSKLPLGGSLEVVRGHWRSLEVVRRRSGELVRQGISEAEIT